MQLFAEDPTLTFEKRASVELEEDPSRWPRQILTELFRVLPEISEYYPQVKVMKLDEEQGFALGVVVITNSTNTALASEAIGASKPKALVPFIVKNGRLAPLDLLMTDRGTMYPLTPERLREALYRPEGFELLSDEWNDQSLWTLFHPPGRGDSNYGAGVSMGIGGHNGGVSYIQGPGMKFAMLEAIRDTVLEPDVTKLAARMEGTPGLLKAAALNETLLLGLKFLSSVEHVDAKTAAAHFDAVRDLEAVDVVQMSYDPFREAYVVKTANRESGNLSTKIMDRGEFLKIAGDELTERVDTEGTVTVSEASPRAIVVADAAGHPLNVLKDNGIYTVYEEATGRPLTGWVITKLYGVDGKLAPVALFVGEKSVALQDQIAGSHALGGSRSDLPSDHIKGTGCFYIGDSIYGLCATVPLKVLGSTAVDENGAIFHCEDFTGEKFDVRLLRGATGIVAFPKEREFVLPHSARFISIDKPEVALVREGVAPELNQKCASGLLQGRLRVVPRGNDTFGLQYHQLPKLAQLGSELMPDQAVFALCVAGLDSVQAYGALNRATHFGSCEVLCKDWGGAGAQKVAEATEAARARVQEVHALRQDLLKEAAVLPDSMTVDAVLSLGFINSENVRTFISMLPYLEKALNRICELVLAARLGITELPEAAAARAARGLDDTIRGLKALALREIRELQ